jgi:hypothetical protein
MGASGVAVGRLRVDRRAANAIDPSFSATDRPRRTRAPAQVAAS